MRVISDSRFIMPIVVAFLLVEFISAFPQSSDSSSTTESLNAPVSDLEASFGGQTTTAAPESTTINRRTGFYYLLDWNSFLDVDDTKGKHVNLRFQPKIGDPRRFLSVKTP